MTKYTTTVTREKHLDHMVKVVPLIVCGYAVQCYFISGLEREVIAINGLMFLGACLVAMIAGFIVYDMTHVVKIEDESFSVSVSWLKYSKSFVYTEVSHVEVSESAQSFATLIITLKTGKKMKIFFVDDADKIKTSIDQRCICSTSYKTAA